MWCGKQPEKFSQVVICTVSHLEVPPGPTSTFRPQEQLTPGYVQAPHTLAHFPPLLHLTCLQMNRISLYNLQKTKKIDCDVLHQVFRQALGGEGYAL